MADETLKIRVDVEVAKVGEIRDAVKGLNKEINNATREELPGLIAKKKEYTDTLNKLIPKSESFTQTVKDARKEARVFRFALLETVHGLDGLGTAFGAITGAGESTKQSIKTLTGSMQEGLGAGLGLKFGLDAMGGSFAKMAGPIGLIVGALTVVGGAFAHHQEQMTKNREEAEKLTDQYLKLQQQLGLLTRAQIANNAEADLELARQKLREAQEEQAKGPGVLERASFGLFGGSGGERTNAISAARNAVLEKELAVKAVRDTFRKEDEAANKETLNKEKENTEKFWHDLEVGWKENAEHLRKIKLELSRPLGAQGVAVHPIQGAAEGQSFEEIMGGWMMGIGVLQQGFAGLAAGISQGLANAFGEANSLFEMFVQGILQGIAQIATSLASSAIISGIFSLLGLGPFGAIFSGLTGGAFASGGTIYEPVVGVGASGRTYMIGESGPERIAPLTNFSGNQGGGTQRVIVEGRVRGRDIYYVNKQSQIIDRKMGGR